MRKLGGRLPDRELAVTMNRMRLQVRGRRHLDDAAGSRAAGTALHHRVRSGDGGSRDDQRAQEAAHRLGIYITSVHRLIQEGTLPATQLMPWAPWQIPVEALESEAVRTGVQEIIARRPGNAERLQDLSMPRLPGI